MVQNEDGTPQMQQDGESIACPVSCFTANTRKQMCRRLARVGGKHLESAWDCSQPQNLPKMKKAVPDSHPAADAAAAAAAAEGTKDSRLLQEITLPECFA